jgi:regulation of enolase protein 1 (concanavalin A-like superfamily)
MHYRYLLLLSSITISASAAPVPKDSDAARLKQIYGTWTDPDKDCKYGLKGDQLKVSLPAAWHLLWPERQNSTNNAPRALREVEGDFSAIVRVTFPLPERVPEEHWPYCSGGLLVWESEKAFMIIRRSGGEVNGSREAIWMYHKVADFNRMEADPPSKIADSAFLRLKRDGDRIIPSWSRDGKKWRELDPRETKWSPKVKVGVVAENCLGTAVEITFDQYSLTQPKK